MASACWLACICCLSRKGLAGHEGRGKGGDTGDWSDLRPLKYLRDRVWACVANPAARLSLSACQQGTHSPPLPLVPFIVASPPACAHHPCLLSHTTASEHLHGRCYIPVGAWRPWAHGAHGLRHGLVGLVGASALGALRLNPPHLAVAKASVTCAYTKGSSPARAAQCPWLQGNSPWGPAVCSVVPGAGGALNCAMPPCAPEAQFDCAHAAQDHGLPPMSSVD
jgi:hypothetical protein